MPDGLHGQSCFHSCSSTPWPADRVRLDQFPFSTNESCSGWRCSKQPSISWTASAFCSRKRFGCVRMRCHGRNGGTRSVLDVPPIPTSIFPGPHPANESHLTVNFWVSKEARLVSKHISRSKTTELLAFFAKKLPAPLPKAKPHKTVKLSGSAAFSMDFWAEQIVFELLLGLPDTHPSATKFVYSV